jgi:hypothetical protein
MILIKPPIDSQQGFADGKSLRQQFILIAICHWQWFQASYQQSLAIVEIIKFLQIMVTFEMHVYQNI